MHGIMRVCGDFEVSTLVIDDMSNKGRARLWYFSLTVRPSRNRAGRAPYYYATAPNYYTHM